MQLFELHLLYFSVCISYHLEKVYLLNVFHLVVFLGGSVSGSDNEEEESDDDVDADNLFFDAKDFLSSSSTRSTDSDDGRSSFDSAVIEFHPSEDGLSSGTRFATSDYPYVKRRKKLPEPSQKEKGVSLWSMIKDNIGKDLTKVCLPVFFNEPLSSLQRCFEDFEYSYLLDQAYEWGKTVIVLWAFYLFVYLSSLFPCIYYTSYISCYIWQYRC